MNLDEARWSRAKQLNAQGHLKRQEEQLRKVSIEQEKIQNRYDAFLPSTFISEFENRFIRKRDSQTAAGIRKRSRSFTVWRAAQRMVVAIAVEPSEWFYYTYEIYDYFYTMKMSYRYLTSILKIANLWGFFISKKFGRPFLPIPLPRGYEKQRLVDANYEKATGVSRASLPIHSKDLARVGGKMNQANFNWIYLSIWFGLRPKEIDSLQKKEFWKVEVLPNGRKILWVFQTKIIALPPEDRPLKTSAFGWVIQAYSVHGEAIKIGESSTWSGIEALG